MKGGKKAGARLRGLRILYEDPDVFVVEKAAGVLSQAPRGGDAPSVEGALTDYVRKGQWKSAKRVYLVHRLDRETSGVMMVAKTEAAQDWLRDHWNEATEKIYLARVEGALDAPSGLFESYLREDERYFVRSVKDPRLGKLARTAWRVLAPPSRRARTSLVEVTLKSGRKNQIRVHFSEAGHPVAGDAKYGRGRRGDTLCLHAWKLAFRHPRTGERLSFASPPPPWTAFPASGKSERKETCHEEEECNQGTGRGEDRRPGAAAAR